MEFRDAVYQWDAPFTTNPIMMAKTIDRFAGILWGNSTLAVMYDNWFDTRNTRTYLFNHGNTGQAPQVISARNSQDIYSDPGNFETKKNQFFCDVLLFDKDNLFLIGDGYTKNGQFPFVDQLNIKTLKSNRIYQSVG